jgi:hypothetical protein
MRSSGSQRSRQRHGVAGQNLAAGALARAGVAMVEKIGTPIRMIGVPGTPTFRVVFEEKVSGDHRGVLGDGSGKSVLAETKTVLDGNLTWSRLREHQPERLTYHHELGGISLLVWVHSTGVYIMRWPIGGFDGPRKSITPDQANQISVASLLD